MKNYSYNNYNPMWEYSPPRKTRIPIKSIFLAKSGGYSSKRICGVIGWLVAMFCFIWCVIKGTSAPDFATELVAGCVALLGVDSVSNAISGFRR